MLPRPQDQIPEDLEGTAITSLTSDSVVPDQERYSRQILFPGIGQQGQQLLGSAHVAIVGVGATGAATASLLARAGVGTLTLIDRDFVEPSNLQRQILFDEADARESLPKAEAARRKIALFNSSIAVHRHIADLVPANIDELLGPADLILDATDNFETRYLINDYAVRQSVPWIYAAAIGAYGATMNVLPAASSHQTACLACIFPKPPTGPVETCDTSGILSTAVNFAASIQSTEALKLLTGQPERMRRTLLSFDLWTNERSRYRPRSRVRDVWFAANESFLIWPGRAGPTLLCAAVTPSRSTSGIGPSICPLCAPAWLCRPTFGTSGPTTCCSAFAEGTLPSRFSAMAEQ